MKSNVKKNDLAYIIAPAAREAQGHFVQVLRLASGDHGADGAAFAADDFDAGQPIWIVRGNQIPWGGGLMNVFAISDVCLRPIRGLDSRGMARVSSVADAEVRTSV